MATKITIGNKTTAIPGVYSQIKSGIVNPASDVNFGNIIIIDDGSFGSTNYIATNGIVGENKQGLDSVQTFTEVLQTQSTIWDSELLPILKSLFRPSRKNGVLGINKLHYIQASETTKAVASFPFAKGTLSLKTQFEGVSLNGGLTTKTYDPADDDAPLSNELSKGLALRLETGRAFGFSLAFYRGTHDKMSDPLNPGYSFQEKSIDSIYQGVSVGVLNIAKPILLFRSPDVKRLSELKRWMDRSPDFKKWFGIVTFPFSELDDAITSADITANQTALAPYKLFSGGTTVFNDAAYSLAVELSKTLDNTFYLSLKGGDDAIGTENTELFTMLTSGDLKYEKYGLVAGYTDSSNFLGDTDTTQAVANYFNSNTMIVTHGLAKVTNSVYPSGFRNISVLEKTAKVLGRICGLPPQTPLTFKDIAIDAEVHKLSESEQEAGIEAGILCTLYDQELGTFRVLAGINTLGNNDFLVNDDATSYDISVERIKSQLNREIAVAAKQAFFGGEQGANRNTISTADLLTWTTGFLQSKVATDTKDNLIIRFDNIVVRVDQDNYFVDYEFVPNFPVNKIIFTGIILGS